MSSVFYDPAAGAGVFELAARKNQLNITKYLSHDIIPAAIFVEKQDFFSSRILLEYNVSIFTNLPFRTLKLNMVKQKHDLLGPNPNLYQLFLIHFLKNMKNISYSAVIIPKSFLSDASSQKLFKRFQPHIHKIWSIEDSESVFLDASLPAIVLFFSFAVTSHLEFQTVKRNKKLSKVIIFQKKKLGDDWNPKILENFAFIEKIGKYSTLLDLGVIFKKGEIDMTKNKLFFYKGNHRIYTGKNIHKGSFLFSKIMNVQLYKSSRIIMNDIVNIDKKQKINPSIIHNSHAANSLVYVSDVGKFEQQDLLEYLGSEFVNTYLEKVQYNNHLPIRILNSIPYTRITKKRNDLIYDKKFKMSTLDIEISKDVPIGGNWKNISKKTAQKSKRILRIKETGGRTTLYGRINPSKPSYTITTYFNRPGNGAYLHPNKHRTISLREAARLQTFPETYGFFGNQRQLLTQVGNAIPPLFARQLLQSISSQFKINNSLDLFAGGGGMSIESSKLFMNSIATDCEEFCKKTHDMNKIPGSFIVGDITDKIFRMNLIKNVKKLKVDIVIGGPPCQGFSLAGKRFINDSRNLLYKNFIDVVSHVKPKVVVFENVIGIKSFEKGKMLNDILRNFSELKYEVFCDIFDMSEYGIPQKRKRFILVATKGEKWKPMPKTINQINASIAFSKEEYMKYYNSHELNA